VLPSFTFQGQPVREVTPFFSIKVTKAQKSNRRAALGRFPLSPADRIALLNAERRGLAVFRQTVTLVNLSGGTIQGNQFLLALNQLLRGFVVLNRLGILQTPGGTGSPVVLLPNQVLGAGGSATVEVWTLGPSGKSPGFSLQLLTA
jgi:hypothetical protein